MLHLDLTPTLLVIRRKNVVAHAESLSKILNFEPEDECNSIPVAASERRDLER